MAAAPIASERATKAHLIVPYNVLKKCFLFSFFLKKKSFPIGIIIIILIFLLPGLFNSFCSDSTLDLKFSSSAEMP